MNGKVGTGYVPYKLICEHKYINFRYFTNKKEITDYNYYNSNTFNRLNVFTLLNRFCFFYFCLLLLLTKLYVFFIYINKEYSFSIYCNWFRLFYTPNHTFTGFIKTCILYIEKSRFIHGAW